MRRDCFFNVGDRVRALVTSAGIVTGQIYVVEGTYDDGDDWLVAVRTEDGDYLDNEFYDYRFQKASTDLLGDAIRRAYHAGRDDARAPFEPESFVGRDDIDWARMIREGGQS